MMENYSITPLTADQNGRVITQPLPLTNFSGFEEEESGWNPRQFLGIIQRRALVITGIATIVMGIATYATLTEKPTYQGTFQLLVEPINEDSTLGKVAVDNPNSNRQSLDYDSQIQILKSPELMSGIVKELRRSYPDITYDSLLSSLNISRLGETKIIEVSYISPDPSRIQVVLDKIAQSYLKYSLEKRKTKLRQGVKFVDEQLPTIKNRVDRLQRELQIFRQRYNFISPESQEGEISSRFSNLSSQRIKLNQELAVSRANYDSLSQEEGKQAALNNSVAYQKITGDMHNLEVQISAESARLQPDNPSMQLLEEKRKNLLSLLQKEAQHIIELKYADAITQLQTLEIQNQELAKAERQVEQQAKLLPILSRKYTELQRDLKIATESLNRFLTTRETLQIQVAQTELPWELVKAASWPRVPISPNIPRGLTLGFVSSLVLGVGVAFLLEKTDNTYHSIDTLKEDIKLPILGVLPFDKKLQNLRYQNLPATPVSGERTIVSEADKRNSGLSTVVRSFVSSNNAEGSKFWEALQVLYANIELFNFERPIRSLVVSSAQAGDGKSTVAFQLAQTARAMGKRVLLVDANLRQPQLHQLSDLDNVEGLSSVITTDLPVKEVIQEMPGMNDLYVMTAGPILPDPAKLLSSAKMKQLMAYFHQSFDLVIYDVPCLVGIVDARLLAAHTDGMLLVARLDKTDKTGLAQAQDLLKISPVNVLGIVANGDKSKLNE